MSISAHVYHLLLMVAFPGVGSQQRVIGQWRARRLCQVGMAPQSDHTRAQLVNMPVSPTVDQLLRSGVLPVIGNQSEPIGGGGGGGVSHWSLPGSGRALLQFPVLNICLFIYYARRCDLLCAPLPPARTPPARLLQ